MHWAAVSKQRSLLKAQYNGRLERAALFVAMCNLRIFWTVYLTARTGSGRPSDGSAPDGRGGVV